TVTSEGFAQTFIRTKTSANSQWTTVAVDQTAGSNLSTRIDGIITGQTFDYRASRVNILNPSLYRDTDITSKTAPSDASAPGAPGTPVVLDKHLKSITLTWTAASGGDIDDYEWEVRTAASGGGSQVATGRAGTIKTSLTLNTIAYSATRYFRVRAKDYSGNVGAWSADRSFSFSKVLTIDVDDDQVTTPKLPNNAITASGAYSNDGTATANTGSQVVEIGTVTVTTDGGAVIVVAKAMTQIDAGAYGFVRLRKTSTSGTVLDEVPLYTTYDSVGLIGYDASPSASQTYKLVLEWVSGANIYAFYRRLVTFNLKK
ncbi:MAG TPA: fibronectin type III domain-containing protein, partial [Verrucomicrobiae bacterium]|nr:fibronectin type III domain-containing protein [Verrucomicrobiae bacterium]